MKPKRVLHVLKYYRPRYTGEGAFMERCAGYMQVISPELEHELLVTATVAPDRDPAACSPVSRIHYISKRPLSAWHQHAALALWFVRSIHRFSTVHVRTHADRYFLSYLLTRLSGRRIILSATLDDSVPVLVDQYRPKFRWLARRLLGLFNCFISVSPKLHNETSAVMPGKQCEMIPYGITMPDIRYNGRQAIRQRLGIPEEALVLIFVGGLQIRKDTLFLIDNLPPILRQYPDTILMLVGPEIEPAYVAKLRSRISELGIQGSIAFTGQVPDAHPYFQAADIMTFSSLREGFGMVVPEAQANCLPVVVRHLPGVNDLFVKDGETGFFFTDAAGYVSAVLKLAADPALRRQIGERARAFVRSTFGMVQVARRYLDVYGFPAPPRDIAEPSETEWDDVRLIGADSSIVNPRFHEPVCLAPTVPPLLITLIDAEESFDWRRKPFTRQSLDVSSMAAQQRSHRVFERYAVKPTYMVDYPVACQENGAAPLRELLASGQCDIGAQLHAWVTPPFEEDLTVPNSYSGNLPLAMEYRKIRYLTEAIETTFGVAPRIFRSGRYGAGVRTGDILKHLGYLADSSVMPGWSFRDQGGPDFIGMTTNPYWIDAAHTLLEIPGTSGSVGRWAEMSSALQRLHFSHLSERLYWPALSSRFGLMERIRLTPEGITIPEAKRLVRHMRNHGQSVFVLTYHTPSLQAGGSPYARTEQDVIRLLEWLDCFYDFFTREMKGQLVTWRDVRARVSAPASDMAQLPAALAA